MKAAAGSNVDLHFIPEPEKPTVVIRGVGQGEVGIARVLCTTDNLGQLRRPVIEDAFLVSHHLSNFRSDTWVNGKLIRKPQNITGLTTIHDFRHDIAWHMHTAFDTLTFHLPRVVLETVLPDARAGRLEDLAIEPSCPKEDATIAALMTSMLPALATPQRISLLFLDHLSYALATHVITTCGQLTEVRSNGTLALWQERRIKEMIAARLDGEIRLADLAAECRMSVGHFVRAFRRTANTTPHQWLLQRRVDHAKALMKDGTRPLVEVALNCGFADQSHFTRTFSRLVGISPRAWRNNHVTEDAF